MHMHTRKQPCRLERIGYEVFTPLGASLKAGLAVTLELVFPTNYRKLQPEEAPDELQQINGPPVQ
jgi:hypothetical protein